MNDEERYLFDVMGYLVVEDVLTPDEVQEMHTALGDEDLWSMEGWRNDPNFIAVGNPHTAHESIRRLIAHPRIVPYLQEMLGPSYRYDHGHYILARDGSKQLGLHGGGTPFDPASYYWFKEGAMHNGLVAVAYSLVDAGPEDGGFAAIPGSHKANLRCPPHFLNFEKIGPWVVRVPVRAGSAIIFTEALTHGTWPWRAEYERRAVFVKFSPGNSAWGGNPYPSTKDAPEIDYKDDMRQVLRPPFYWDHEAGDYRAPVFHEAATAKG